jgi:LAO/AO transport system kinase
MRRRKWSSDAALVAEAWVADCAASITADPHQTMHNSVDQILKEASARWTQ